MKNRSNRLKRLLYSALLLMIVYLAFSAPFMGSGKHNVNPHARVKQSKYYTVDLWISYPPVPHEEVFADRLLKRLAYVALPENIQLDVQILPHQEATEQLANALAKGSPPDLYVDIGSGQSYYGALQVPLGLYLDPSVSGTWPAGVVEQVSQGETVFGHPLALFPTVMLGNRSLLDPLGLDYETLASQGWRWDAFFSTVESPALGRKFGLAFTNPGELLLRTLATAAGKPSPLDTDGVLLWGTEDLAAMAHTWQKLRLSPGVPPGERLTADSLMLFLQQDCAIIGPLNPLLLDWLWTEACASGIDPVIIPIPSDSDGFTGNGYVSSLVLFRQKPYKGHDHTRAAAYVADVIASDLAMVISELYKAEPLLPYAKDIEHENSRTRAINLILNRASNIAREPGPEPRSTDKLWDEIILPLWSDFTTGQISAEEFVHAVYAKLQ